MKWKIVGLLSVGILVGAVLVVGLTSFTMIQFGETKERLKTTTEQQENYISTRKRIDEATKKPAGGNDTDLARKRLLDRQQRKKEDQ